MYADVLHNLFQEREPILKDELKKVIRINNENSFNQALSNMVLFGVLKRFENGIYYIQSSNKKFEDLKPSIHDIIYKKYLNNYNGIRSGAYLLYKYKFTSQVSEYYEILSNNVSSNTRSKKEYKGKVIVSSPKFEINKDNIQYVEFLEIIKYIDLSDYRFNESVEKLSSLFLDLKLDKDLLVKYCNYYKGNRYIILRNIVKGVIDYEITRKY
ncbi:MAG: hypothetical protein PHP65_06110 [Bacilli bacterium]|jgi:hypothetical protein|nr:hypothetical protein [Bacilli bacterium]